MTSPSSKALQWWRPILYYVIFVTVSFMLNFMEPVPGKTTAVPDNWPFLVFAGFLTLVFSFKIYKKSRAN